MAAERMIDIDGDKPIDGVAIVCKYTQNRMSTRPEYYSGRGAIRGDLNSELLEMIYDGVKAEAGDEAAAAFVQFVYDFDKLSATAFLAEFYRFCDRGCVNIPRKHNALDELDVGPAGPGQEIIGTIALFGALCGDMSRDETESIRGPFIQRHRREVTPNKQKERREYKESFFFGPGFVDLGD